MRLRLLFALLLSCAPSGTWTDAGAVLRGALSNPRAGLVQGDAYVLLFDADEGLGPDTLPRYATAIPDERVAAGERDYVIAGVSPGRYLVGTLLDVDENVDLGIDVLSQPGEGDWISEAVEVGLVSGERRVQDLTLVRRILRDPPSFRLEASTPARVVIPDRLGQVVSITIEADGLGLLDTQDFRVRLVDANADGQPDDANGDLIPDLEPQLLLRFRPGLGQTVPTDAAGRAAEVILPLALNPSPFLTALAQDTTREISVAALTGFVVPQAQAVWTSGVERVSEALGAIPIGDYELVVLDSVAGYWKVPNALAERGGALASQGIRFRVEHGTGFDAGTLTLP